MGNPGAHRVSLPVTILSGAALSDAADLYGYAFIAVAMPSAWTAADITFQTSDDGVTFRNVVSASAVEQSLTGVAANNWIQIPVNTDHHYGRFVKLRSGTSAVPANQAADRILKVVGISQS